MLHRNSQNTLHSSLNSIRRSTESKSEGTPLAHSRTHITQTKNHSVSSTEIAKGTYTTSVYIKSPENNCNETGIKTSPVVSLHRINVLEEDNKINIRVKAEENPVYITTAAIHRHSDISNQRSDTVRTNLNFVSIIIIRCFFDFFC